MKILSSLKIIFKDSFYLYIAVIASLIMTYISYWLFYQTSSISHFTEMVKQGEFGMHSYAYGITYVITTIIIILLSGISIALTVWLFKHSKLNNTKATAGNIGGIIAGIFSMTCPVCGSFLLSFLGMAGGLALFPLQGLELKFLSIALLLLPMVYVLKQANSILDCKECNNVGAHFTMAHHNSSGTDHYHAETPHHDIKHSHKNTNLLPLTTIVILTLSIAFFVNQNFLTEAATKMGLTKKTSFIPTLFGINTKTTKTIIAPKLNADGKTTTLVEQPTITEVPANPNTGDAVADAKVVMFPTGKPFYAPEDISFDDPINAQKKWKSVGNSVQLTKEQEARWNNLNNTFTCNYCCGGPNNVTVIGKCGCAHAYAWKGFFRYMIATYGDEYSDDELKGEAYRWSGIWYPKGVLEDYLLATGKGDVLGHKTHGGAGSDGRHGL